MENRIFMSAAEVANELGVSKALAYKMIRQWNGELSPSPKNGHKTGGKS